MAYEFYYRNKEKEFDEGRLEGRVTFFLDPKENRKLETLCNDAIKEMYGNIPDKVITDTVAWELNEIKEEGLGAMYLATGNILNRWSLNSDQVSYRGNICVSFVAYLLGLHSINPFKAGVPLRKDFFYGYNTFGRITNWSLLVPEEIALDMSEGRMRVDSWAAYGNLDEKHEIKIASEPYLDVLCRLMKKTEIKAHDIPLQDAEVMNLFAQGCMKHIPIFEGKFCRKIIRLVKPKNLVDLTRICALSHGDGDWGGDLKRLFLNNDTTWENMITCREDVYDYLQKYDIDPKMAYKITHFVRCGRAYGGWSYGEQYRECMIEHGVPENYIHACEQIRFLQSLSDSYQLTLDAWHMAWYKLHYPKEFELAIKGKSK